MLGNLKACIDTDGRTVPLMSVPAHKARYRTDVSPPYPGV